MRHEVRLACAGAISVLLLGACVAERGTAGRERPARIAGHPNLNGIWEAMNTADWNLEAHSATELKNFWRLGSMGAIPAGESVVVGGSIPYKPEALRQREANRASWPAADPEAKCYMPGIPRATYMPYPFQIVQGGTDVVLFVYSFANSNRTVYIGGKGEAPVDMWMGRSNGHWEGETLVVEVNSNNDKTWLDRAGNYHSAAMRVTERYRLIDPDHLQYEATIEDSQVFTRPWTIRMILYRDVEPHARLLDFSCIEFAESLLYGSQFKTPPQ